MNETSQKKCAETGLTRRGFPVFLENPSLIDAFPVRIKPKPSKKLDDAYMVSPGTGEIVAKGSFAFIEEKEVDAEQFVKVYLDGIRTYGQLSKPGALLFEFVYREMSGRKAKDKDTITLNYPLALMWKPDLARATFFRGMKELLEKSFLFRSIGADNYFVNVRFMFNGDRMVLVKSYRRKTSKLDNPLDVVLASE
jgi:hypothetical protein